MKYKLKDNIKNIGDWQLINDDLIYASNYEVKSYYNEKTVTKLSEYWGIKFLPDFFNVFTNRSFNTFYNYKGEIIKEYDKTNFYYILSEGDLIYYDRISKKTKHNEIDLFNDKLGKSLLQRNFIYFEKNRNIYKVCIDTGNLIWQFPLSQFGNFVSDWGEERNYEIEQFIGVYNDVLWIKISYSSGGLIGLDINTGELKHQLTKANKFIGKTDTKPFEEEKVPFYRCDYILQKEEGKIIGLAIDFFYEVNLNEVDPKITVYGLDEEYSKFRIQHSQGISKKSILINNQLYFYSYNQHIFAILDIETKKIIYVSDKISVPNTENAWGQLKDLQVSGDKVYVLDSINNLHIFEKS